MSEEKKSGGRGVSTTRCKECKGSGLAICRNRLGVIVLNARLKCPDCAGTGLHMTAMQRRRFYMQGGAS